MSSNASSSTLPKHASSSSSRSTSTSLPLPIQIPKGNPSLGPQIAHLSKEDRKSAKASDAERIARRMAKKKARNASGLPAPTLTHKMEREKKRERKVRSGASTKDKAKSRGGGKGEEKKWKPRKPKVRSEKAVSKLNGKK